MLSYNSTHYNTLRSPGSKKQHGSPLGCEPKSVNLVTETDTVLKIASMALTQTLDIIFIHCPGFQSSMHLYVPKITRNSYLYFKHCCFKNVQRTHTHTHPHALTHTHVRMHTHVHTHTHRAAHSHPHRGTHTHRAVHSRAHKGTHTQRHTHTHTHTHTSTCTHMKLEWWLAVLAISHSH